MAIEDPPRAAAGAPNAAARDAILAERARRGDEEAFAALFERHADAVRRVCRRMLGRTPQAEDALSESFLRARRSLDRYAPDRPFRTWMLSIASHHCIDQLRRRSLEQKIFASDEGEAGLGRDPAPSPLKRLTAAEDRDRLHEAIDTLPEKYRIPLVLRYFNEMDYAGISEALGIERTRVGTLLYRARLRLRERLAPEDAP